MSSEDKVVSNPTSGIDRLKTSMLGIFRVKARDDFAEQSSPIYTGPRISEPRFGKQENRPSVSEETKVQMRMLQMHVQAQTVVMRRKQQARLQAFEEERKNKTRNQREQNKNNNNKLERLRTCVGELKEVMVRKVLGVFERKSTVEILK